MNDTDGLYGRIRMAQQGDREQCGKIIEENSALIKSVAKRFFNRGSEAEDLFQIGCIGMVKAVHSFDFSYGTMFSTYAVPKIAGEIRRFLRDDGMIKVSRGIKEEAAAVERARREISARTGADARLSEISELTGLSAEQIASCECARAEIMSLSAENPETGQTIESVLSGGQTEDDVIEKVFLTQALKKLEPDEQQIIRLRFYKGLTQQQTARILNFSQVKVSRAERRALDKLRRICADE